MKACVPSVAATRREAIADGELPKLNVGASHAYPSGNASAVSQEPESEESVRFEVAFGSLGLEYSQLIEAIAAS
jgi:hypothetical protein